MPMKKTLKQIFVGTLLTVFIIISGLVTIIFFPQPLFAHTLEHKQFNIYSNQEIQKEVIVILENALQLVAKSELYDPDYRFDIFLAHHTYFNKLDDKVLGYGPSARATDNNIIIKVAVDIPSNAFFATFYQACKGNLTYLIAHEMVHCLQDYTYGKLTFNPFRHPEYWKLEGYPEYIARQPALLKADYELTCEIDRYTGLERNRDDFWMTIEAGGCKVPKYYYKSRLMTEYLMGVRKYTYDQILNDTTSEDGVYAAMLEWKNGSACNAK